MRQRSLAGPVILIVIGILFLANNLRPEFSFWANFGRYWPFLLIAFGALRMAEVLLDAGRGRPLPPRRAGGGTGIGFLIVICIVFWAVGHNRSSFRTGPWNSAWNNNGLEFFGDQFDYPVSSKGPAGGVTLLILDNLRGNITVTGAEGDDYSAEGRKTIRAYNKGEADAADGRSALLFVREGNQLVVKMDDRHASSDRRISTDLDLKVPRGVALEARGRSGDISVNTLDGTVDIVSDRGDVRLSGVGGNAKISLSRSGLIRAVDMKGNVDLEGKGSDVQLQNIGGTVTLNGSYSGTLEFKNLSRPLHFESPQTDMRLEAIPGSLTMDLSDLRASGVTGPMHLKTKSRDVHLDDFSDTVEIDLDRGDIDLSTAKTPVAKIDLHVRNGNVDLALPSAAVFDLNASTHQGEAHNDFGSAVKLEMDGRSASLRSVAGKGAAVTVSTDRGSVSLRKSGVSAE